MVSATIRWVAWVLFRIGMLERIRPSTNRWVLEPGRKTGWLVLRSAPRVRRLQVLVLHRVLPRRDEYLDAIDVETFGRLMAFLAKSCNVVDLADAVERLEEGEIPENAIAITFDDGYRDNLEHAYPVLRAYSMPATIFLVTDCIGTGRVLWHDRVFRAFRLTKQTSLPGWTPDEPPMSLDGEEQRARARLLTLRRLKRLDSARRERKIVELLERLDVDDKRSVQGLMLDWDEVRELHRGGISFGAHTVDHPILSEVAEEEAWRQISESKQAIERELGFGSVAGFAYPNGGRRDFHDTTKSLVRDAGFGFAVTTIFGSVAGGPTLPFDRFELRRMPVERVGVASFAARLDFYRMRIDTHALERATR